MVSAMKKLTMAAILCLLIGLSAAHAQVGTAFTYQGRLTDAGGPASGAFDFEFQLFKQASGGAGSSLQILGDVTVASGLFTVKLDFGAEFTGSPRWLEVRVRPGASDGAYTALTPRQELTPSPNALFAASSATVTAGGVNTTQIADGAVTSLKLGPGSVTSGAIASGQVVKSVNGLADTVTIAGSGGATVSTAGSTITVAAAPPTLYTASLGQLGAFIGLSTEANATSVLNKTTGVSGQYLVQVNAQFNTAGALFFEYHCKLQALAFPALLFTPYSDLPGTTRNVSWRIGQDTGGATSSVSMQAAVTAGGLGIDVRMVCWGTVEGSPVVWDYGYGLESAIITLLPVGAIF